MPGARWASARELVRAWSFKTGVRPERMAVLQAVWDRELGHMSPHWRLLGVRRGTLYVRTRSPAASQELQLRGHGIARALNKHFKTAWIKDVKPATR